MHYQHILLATDFSDHCQSVAERARTLADQNQARLSLVHVVEYMPAFDTMYEPAISYDFDITEELVKSAKKRLVELAGQLNVIEDQQWVEVGSAKTEIVRIAEKNAVDLIVIGSHGRHGLALLLGSTATGVLHHAQCDVLAVRLKEE